MSTQVDKYRKIEQKAIDKYGESNGIYIDKFDGKPNAFLIQNMFPITEKYISHIHTRNNNPVPVNIKITKEVKKRVNKALALLNKGIKIIFPDVNKIKRLMLDEIREAEKTSIETKKQTLANEAVVPLFSRNLQKQLAEQAMEQPAELCDISKENIEK